MKPPQTCNRHLEAKDVLLLSVLGAVHDRPKAVDDIIETAKDMAPQEWQPTGELVGNCIATAMDRDLLRFASALAGEYGSAPALEITESGRSALRRLLGKSIPCQWGGFNRTCVAAKLCFLECLDAEERAIQIDALAQDLRHGIEGLKRHADQASSRRSAPNLWLHHEIERHQWELTWLDRLRSAMRPPARPGRRFRAGSNRGAERPAETGGAKQQKERATMNVCTRASKRIVAAIAADTARRDADLVPVAVACAKAPALGPAPVEDQPRV